jgi:hypothetical protein
MDHQEARTLLRRVLAEYRKLPYSELAARVGGEDHQNLVGRSGAQYQLEVQFRWDHEPGDIVMVIGSIDDGGWRAIVPLSESFLVDPQGMILG